MALIVLQGVSFDHGGPPVLDRVDLAIESGERLALVGRNGAGKSTLLRILADELPPHEGRIGRQQGLRTTRLLQEIPRELDGTIGSRLHEAVKERGGDSWTEEREVELLLRRFDLDGSRELAELSAGVLRRALFAAAFGAAPDLLLLDEPTNHLDIESIAALEEAARAFRGAIVFVTHDRAFLGRVATGILELDRGRLVRHPGDFDAWIERRDERLALEEAAQAEFEKNLAGEEAWIRRGVKARRTRNQGRVRRLLAMRDEHRARRSRAGTAEMRIQEAAPSGRLVFRSKGLGFDFGGPPIVRGLDLEIQRGDRLGIVGPNGCGKSTLVRLLLGEIAPKEGTIRRGANVEAAWFDQHQEQLDPTTRVQDAVAGGATKVLVGGAERHVISLLSEFLFTPEQSRGSVAKLSGGERSRLLLARLFAKPMNLLVLDEPTNDLDMETLEVLEDLVVEFQGTLIVVSHDRAFLDAVVTSTLVFEGGGNWKEYDGGWADVVRARAAQDALGPAETPRCAAKPADRPAERAGRRKLGNKERKELEELPARIEALEAEQRSIEVELSDPAIYRKDPAGAQSRTARLAALPPLLEAAYRRWEELAGME